MVEGSGTVGAGRPAGSGREIVSEIAVFLVEASKSECPHFRFAQPCDEPPRAARRSAHHAPMLTRRKFAKAAAAAGAVLAFGKGRRGSARVARAP